MLRRPFMHERPLLPDSATFPRSAATPEFAHVQNQDEAHQVARRWLERAIDYAHQRKTQIWLGTGDGPMAPPNLAQHSPTATASVLGTRLAPPGIRRVRRSGRR